MDLHPSARLEHVLPGLMDELADARTPDYLEAAIERASSHSQRAAWTFPERWLPMDIAATPVQTARFPIRALGILALVALLIAGALIVYTGTQNTPAPPFGLAENGHIAIVSDGDLLAVDQATGEVTDLVTGPEEDSHPAFSLDGTRLAFQRRFDAATSHVLVAAWDGSGETVVTPEPLHDVGTIRFSPATDQVLIEAKREGVPSFALVGIDGSGFRWLEIDGPAERAVFVPDGDAIVFVTMASDDVGEGLARFDLPTQQTTKLVAGIPQSFVYGTPSISPDGRSFAFGFWVNSGNASTNARNYTMPVDGSATLSMIPAPLDICCQANPAWSNDGNRIASQRIYADHQVVAIYDAETGGTGVEFVAPSQITDITVAWSPDDRYVLATYWSAYASEPGDATELEHVVIDSTTGALVEGAWDNAGPAAWQRVGR